MANSVAPIMHMAKSSANMSRIMRSIWCSMRLRLLGGRLAFFITCCGSRNNTQMLLVDCLHTGG